MNNQAATTKKMIKVPQAALLSLVASTLGEKDLFPKKTQAAKKYLKGVKFPEL